MSTKDPPIPFCTKPRPLIEPTGTPKDAAARHDQVRNNHSLRKVGCNSRGLLLASQIFRKNHSMDLEPKPQASRRSKACGFKKEFDGSPWPPSQLHRRQGLGGRHVGFRADSFGCTPESRRGADGPPWSLVDPQRKSRLTNSCHATRRLQPFRHLHDGSGCFRLERSPGGPCTHWKAPPYHGAHPQRSFKFTDANVRFRIAKLTLPTKRSLCAAVIGSLVRFLSLQRNLGQRSAYAALIAAISHWARSAT